MAESFATGSAASGLLTPRANTAVHHKANHAAIVVEDKLYVFGGEYTDYKNGTDGKPIETSYRTWNSTALYVYDLTRTYPQGVPAPNLVGYDNFAPQSGAAWTAKNGSGYLFYQYDGGISTQEPFRDIPGNALLGFKLPKNKTAPYGSTSLSTQSAPGLARVQSAAYASGNGYGFALGGMQGSATTSDVEPGSGNFFTPGMITYDMQKDQFTNTTAGGQYANGSTGAAGVFVPRFGPAGLFVPLAGYGPSSAEQSGFALDEINMFEPRSQQWKIQKASGDIPSTRQFPCAVGAAGDNGTYEIFMYGGLPMNLDDYGKHGGDVFVLSLPAFRWFKSPAAIAGRHRHACVVAGNRQMISVSGVVEIQDNKLSSDVEIGQPDPKGQGNNIFDMTALAWTTSFNYDAAPYVTPDLVKSYITRASRITFDDSTVASWFNSASPTIVPTASAQPTQDASSSGLAAGVIAGTVIGAVVGLAAIAAVISFLVIRSRKRAHSKTAYANVPPVSARHSDYAGSYKEYSRHEIQEVSPI